LRLRRLALLHYQSFVVTRVEVASFGGILAGMNRMSRVVEKLTAKTDDTQDAWVRLAGQASSLLLSILWIIAGLLRGPLHLKEWIHILQFWTGVVIFPFGVFLLVVNIRVLRKVRRRELQADLAALR
jgi:hypothetical protein